MEHLDDARLQALLADPGAHRALAEHVATGCEACDGYLEQGGAALDGLADRLLLAVGPERSSALDEVGWLRLRRRVRRPVRLGALAAAAAVAVVGLVAVGLSRGPAVDGGLKGSPRLQLELSGAVRDATGGVHRVESGARIRSGGVLLLRAHVTEATPATLWLERQDGRVEPLGAVRLEPGTHDLEREGELVGVGLSEERGLVTVWVVAGQGGGALSPAEAARRVQSGELRDVAVGRMVLVVEP